MNTTSLRSFSPSSKLSSSLFTERFEVLKQMHDEMLSLLGDSASAQAVVERILEKFGGTQIYIPTPACVLREARDRTIYSRFNGQNVSELACEFGLSYTTIYKVIRRARQNDRAS